MNRSNLTVLLAMSAFSQRSAKIVEVTPDTVTRFAFDKGGYQKVQISNQTGPQSDGMLEVIDVTKLNENEIDVKGYDCALIVRVESTRGLDSFVAQAMGKAIEAYMDMTGVSSFATAAIADIAPGQELHGKWNTILLLRDSTTGLWIFKNLRFTSVQRSTDEGYAVLSGNQIGKIDDGYELVSTLIDTEKLKQVLAGGFELEKGKYHLVRAPINQSGAYAVVGNGTQIVYDDEFHIVVSGQTGFTVMPAIDVDGNPKPGQVTTISGSGNNWDVRKAIPASKADNLAQAYGAAAA